VLLGYFMTLIDWTAVSVANPSIMAAAELADGTTAYEVGRNPLSIVVPCHRVVGKDCALTGYAGSLKRKRFLLDLEEPEPAVAGRLF